MADPAFAVGDRVTLASPVMTVISTDGPVASKLGFMQVECEWFVQGQRFTRWFDATLLERSK